MRSLRLPVGRVKAGPSLAKMLLDVPFVAEAVWRLVFGRYGTLSRSQAGGIRRDSACAIEYPRCRSRSTASSSDPESEVPFDSTWLSARPGIDVESRSRARIQARLPPMVLISPLCARTRNGCASAQSADVFVRVALVEHDESRGEALVRQVRIELIERRPA